MSARWLAGFLMKGTGNIQQTLSILCALVVISALCAIAVRFTINSTEAVPAARRGLRRTSNENHRHRPRHGRPQIPRNAWRWKTRRTCEVTVLCEEPRPAYDRVHLSEFFAGKSADDLSLVAPGFFDKRQRAAAS